MRRIGPNLFTTRRDNGERGAVMVFFVLSLTLLILFAGLAIDVPIAMNERRTAQNAADHAALAAAYAFCQGEDEATAAETSAAANGYAASELSLVENGDGDFSAEISTSSDSFFASIIGIDEFAVATDARAECTGGGGSGYAIFAIGDTCDKQIDVSGSNQEFYGGIHSNRNIHTSGSSNDYGGGNGVPPVDEVTRVSTANSGGGSFSADPGYPQYSPTQAPPFTFDIGRYRPGGGAATAAAALGQYFDFTGSEIKGEDIDDNGDGLYYTDDKIDIGDSDLSYNVTLVSEYEDDGIKISGSNVDLHPYVDGLLAFSTMDHSSNDDKCSKFSIAMSGSSNSWSGVVYAPDGMIEMSGSSNSTLTGSLIAYTVKLNGSDLRIQADPSGTLKPPITRLTE